MPDKGKIKSVKGKEAVVAMGKKKPADNKRLVEKKLLAGFYNKEIPLDKKRVRDMVATAAKQSGLSPELLYSSMYQEGLRNIEYIGLQNPYENPNWEDDRGTPEFPVDGFTHYGLDTFGEKYDALSKKGYIPKGFNFERARATNEKGQSVGTGFFKNNEDAMIAKAAMMRDLQDQVQEYAKGKGLNIQGDELSYLMMAGYNGGLGRSQQMIDEIIKMKVSPKDYVSKGMTSLKGIHKNIEPRMRYIEIMREVSKEDEKKAWMDMMRGPQQPFNPFSQFMDKNKPIIGILAGGMPTAKK